MFQHTALSYTIFYFNIAVSLDLKPCFDNVYAMHHISHHFYLPTDNAHYFTLVTF
jgi:hypothetical protein